MMLAEMHCRVAHCRRMICDQGEFRGTLLGGVGEALLVFFCGRQGRLNAGFSLTSCYCCAVRYWYNACCLLVLCRGLDSLVSILPGLAIEASMQALSIHHNDCTCHEGQSVTRYALWA
jgi:hypothetical protein